MYRTRLCSFAVFLAFLSCIAVRAQEQKRPLTSGARLAAAKTAFLRNGGGSAVAFKEIGSILEGWGHFVLVESVAKADVVIEVSAPEDGGNGVSVSSTSRTGPLSEKSSTTTRAITTGPVRMTVFDPQSNLILWSATEQPKFAMKTRAREDRLIEAADKLMERFRLHMEPRTGAAK